MPCCELPQRRRKVLTDILAIVRKKPVEKIAVPGRTSNCGSSHFLRRCRRNVIFMVLNANDLMLVVNKVV